MAASVAVAAKPRQEVLYPRAQWYFLLAMSITWLGFAHSYFLKIRTEPLLHHVHGALMGGWIGLLVVQPLLYQRGQLRWYRLLGRWGAFALVPGIVVCGLLMVRGMLRATHLPHLIVDQLAFLDLGSLLLLLLFVGLAIWYGRRLALHARYIVCTVLLLMPPAVARALFVLPGMRVLQRNVTTSLLLVDLVLVLLMLDDVRRGGRVRAPYPVAMALFSAMSVASGWAHGWGWWQTLARSIAGTP